MRLVACVLLVAAGLRAQQFKLELAQLAAKASDSVDISLAGATLQFAARFLDANKPDEAKVKKLLSGIEAIYVRSYEFKSEGAWTQADVDAIRNQLRSPEWSRIVGVKSSQEGVTSEVWLRDQNKKITGIAVLAVEPKEFTVVNIVGALDLDALAQLGGHFGVPGVTKAPSR